LKAAKDLSLLLAHYPEPAPVFSKTTKPTISPTFDINIVSAAVHTPTEKEMMKAYPTIFDGQVRNMQGEEFHISFAKKVQAFCIYTLWTIPFAYCNKLQANLIYLNHNTSH